MSRLPALVAAALVIASCSGGSDDTSEPVESAPPTTAEAPVGTPASSEPGDADDEPATPTPEPPPGDTAFDQLAALARDESVSELDLALAELSAFVGPIPGVPTLLDDGSVYPSLTHVLDEIERERDELTPEQAAAVDAGIDALFPADAIIEEFSLFDDGDTGAEGFAPLGFASAAPASSGDDPPLVDAPSVLRTEVLRWAGRVSDYLGGPFLNIWVQTFPAGALGSDVAGRNRGLPLGHPERTLERGNPDCLIQLALGSTAADIAGIVAHEITHCWQFVRLGSDNDRWNATGDWVLEGQAAYVGHVIGGLTRFNDSWWRFYLNDLDPNGQWNMYRSSYDAIGFWARVDEGADLVAAMQRSIDAAPSNSAMLAAAISDLGAATTWLGAGTFQRSDWGAGWTSSSLGDPGTPRRSTAHEVGERNDIALSADAGTQANHEISVAAIDDADGTVMFVAGRGTGVVRFDPDDIVLGDAAFTDEWCLERCVCPDDTNAFPPERVLGSDVEFFASLVGQPADSSTLTVRIAPFDPETSDRCEEDEDEPEPDPDPVTGSGGLIGAWRASPDSVANMFEQASAFGDGAVAIEVTGASGDVRLTFREDGTGNLVYDRVTLFLADEVLGDLTLNGSGTFSWTTAGGPLQIDGTQFRFSVSSSALGGELLTISDADVPAAGTTVLSGAVAGNELTITAAQGSAGDVFFPVSWTRIGPSDE